MITEFKIYESQYNPRFDLFDNIFRNHLSGSYNDSEKLVGATLHYFDNKIPNDLKYKGTVYRIIQFRTKEQYDKILKKGMIPFENQIVWSCTKYLNSTEDVKRLTWHKKYKYFIIFQFDVDYDDVLFDVNKMKNYIWGVGHSFTRYSEENEVIILTKNIKIIPKENIIKHGKLI